MNGRQIIRQTLDYERPERVGRSFGDSDMTGVIYSTQTPATPWAEVGGGRWERIDEWGNLWARVDPTSKGEVVRGVLEGVKDWDQCQFPDFSRQQDYRQAAAAAADSDKWIIGSMPGFTFNIARKLFKLENYLCDLMLEPQRIHRLHDRIDMMLQDMIRGYARAGVDCIMFPEDWGTQTQTLVNPAVWREEFFPRFQKLCGLAHDGGLRVFMHSCGAIGAIIPGLMEAGVDLFQFDQPRLHGIDTLAAYQERGKITFWCPVDIQKTLQTGNEALIRAEARELLDKLWRGRGGFIAGFYGDNASIGLDPRWQRMACEEFTERGVRDNYL